MTSKPSNPHKASSPENVPGDIVHRLRRFPEIDPPEGLPGRIMGALKPRRRPWWQVMLFRWSRPRRLTFTPLKWVPVGVALALGLTIGFSLNRMPSGPAPQPAPQTAHLTYDAEAHYMRGRQLLAENRAEKALVHLRKAADTRPDQAHYQFWLGVTYWTLEDLDQERAYYQSALQRDPDFLPAHVYIGHNYLDRGDYNAARQHYRYVLQTVPDHAEALFNTGVALHQLGDVTQENMAWRAYLEHYDRGEPALQAAERLNANGDFSFRRIQLGPLSLVKPVIRFGENPVGLDAASQATLDDIGRVLTHNHKLELHVLAYAASDAGSAQKRAKAVKRYLLDSDRDLSAQRIKPSWFGVSEKVQIEDRFYELETSIHLFAIIIDEF